MEGVIPQASIEGALREAGVSTPRERKLNLCITIWVLIGMNLFTRMSIQHVLQRLCQGLRYLWPTADAVLPGSSALCYRRNQLGVRPLRALMRRVCRPLTTPQTRGAFAFGLRLVALDSTVADVPDTPANVRVFGRHRTGRGPSAFPQARLVYLIECGAHSIFDATFWPYRVDEQTGARRLMRSIIEGMLVLWDRGFHEFDLFRAVQQRGSHVLSRLPAHVRPRDLQPLADGSALGYIVPSAYQRRKTGEQIRVRIIEYTLTDPGLNGYGQKHRLVTTLLDPQTSPALELICLYHERWEIELVMDEMDTHQRLTAGPLRSLTPRGVIQELYGWVLAHFALRALMHQAAVRARLDPDRLSFVHALEVVRIAIPEFQMTAPAQHGSLCQRLLRDLVSALLPIRRLRVNPRVVKRKMADFHLKRAEHAHWPQPSMPFRQSVLLI